MMEKMKITLVTELNQMDHLQSDPNHHLYETLKTFTPSLSHSDIKEDLSSSLEEYFYCSPRTVLSGKKSFYL